MSLDVVDTTQTAPFVTSADPDKAVNAGPVVTLKVGLADRVTAVNTNSVRLFLDNNPVPAIIQKSGTNTTISYNAGLLSALSAHTYSVAFTDTGAPAIRRKPTHSISR